MVLYLKEAYDSNYDIHSNTNKDKACNKMAWNYLRKKFGKLLLQHKSMIVIVMMSLISV